MSIILSAEARMGKTMAGKTFCFATNKDVIKLACLCGITDSQFSWSYDSNNCACKGPANYVGCAIGVIEQGYIQSSDQKIEIKSVGLNDYEVLRKLTSALRKGYFLKYQSGCYVSSALTTLAGEMSTESRAYCFDDEGNPTDFDNSSFLVVNNSDEWFFFVRRSKICGEVGMNQKLTSYEGFPYIMLNESAPAIPQKIIDPLYDYTNRDMSVKFKVVQETNANLGKWTQRSLEIPAVLNAFIDAEADANTFLPLQVLACIKEVLDKKNLDKKISSYLRTAYQHMSGAIKLLAKFNYVGSLEFPIIKGQFLEYKDKIVDYEREGSLHVVSVTGIMLNSSRCYIDSINSMLHAGIGPTLPGGLDSEFLNALQLSTTSEAILVHVPKGEETPFSKSKKNRNSEEISADVLSNYNLTGYLAGNLYFSDPCSSKYLSQRSWLYNTRRAGELARHRAFYLVDQNKGLVYGNKAVFDFKRGTIVKSNTPYDPYSKDKIAFEDVREINLKSFEKNIPGVSLAKDEMTKTAINQILYGDSKISSTINDQLNNGGFYGRSI